MFIWSQLERVLISDQRDKDILVFAFYTAIYSTAASKWFGKFLVLSGPY